MKAILSLTLMAFFFLGNCNAADYDYKPENVSNFNLSPTVKNLDLSKIADVDDDFIEKLSKMESSRGLVNINLSETKITEKALKFILGSSVLGTKRELPQISPIVLVEPVMFKIIYIKASGPHFCP